MNITSTLRNFFVLLAILCFSVGAYAEDQGKLADFTEAIANEDNPDVDVDDHEGGNWGHCVERHCAKDAEYLQNRAKKIKAASTFEDKAEAEKMIKKVIKSNKSAISNWWERADNGDKEAFTKKTKVDGTVVFKTDRSKVIDIDKSCEILVVLKKKNDLCFILTAYPAADEDDYADELTD